MSPKIIYNSTPYMVAEFIVFYVFFPFLATAFLDGWYKIIPLVLIALLFLFLLLKDPTFDRKVLTRFNTKYLGKSFGRMIIITILLVWFTFWIFPELFLVYPVENFQSYVITFFLYPLASVFPQEIIYRVYFFHRYHEVVPEKYLLMLSNAIVFGLAHFIYANWVAPIATFLAGWIFIYNYYQTRSLLNVSLEHYLYGLIMFTIGFGYFFQ
ncbi:CPBP family intramembrane metalloprotease [Salinimicrobium sp. MT39]|uniref:CPBP family intramembrane metalloprotease n=1 Tax=Salinimicrobium profundisediminis TaxID=2994553 RepID=A0A9X3HZZ9_9FLAO|nr:CPBP family intramembrane glutamic endopeptidase [Salinimicrobium profundisediminis]MCX2837019.1 CPBP family intramembrane metalloprotease [Salinimicrobium profundisediminis]